jgi:dienelactone hydrolase
MKFWPEWFARIFAVSALAADCACAGSDPVFDVAALTGTPLEARVLKSAEKDGIVTEEVMFHSEMDGTNRVDIFAFFSYPKGAAKLPAFIWNQSGLAQASAYFPEFGAKRGYAALCIDFPMPGYRSTGGYPINAGLELGDDPKQAPIYHGAVALLKAVSFLQSRPEVDKDRIGMAGSSWGGFYTTLMCGVDPRLRACSAMFGTGSLHLGNSWWDSGGKGKLRDAAFRERWRTTLDPSFRLPKSKTPIAWFTGSNDFAYWLPAVMATHAAAGGPKHLTIMPNWDHGLPPIIDEQVFAWLDVHLKGGPAFLDVSPLEVIRQGRRLVARWKCSGTSRQPGTGDLMLSYGEAGNWTSRYWIVIEADIINRQYSVDLPAAALPYYISGSVTDTKGFRSSTPLLRVDSASLVVADSEAFPDYDGCSMWGGFEPEQVNFLKALAWMNPQVSTDAREGRQSCVLEARTVARNIYFTAGLPHRFDCYLKAEAETEIQIALTGEFDGERKIEERAFVIGKEWTEVSLDYTPPKCHVGSLSAAFTVREGARALLDSVSFRPVRPR